jgi:hypothetical protein
MAGQNAVTQTDSESDAMAVMRAKTKKGQTAKIGALVAKSIDRADGPPMTLAMKDGVLTISYKETPPDQSCMLMMTDLATVDPAFFSGVTGQIAKIGSHGQKVDEANSNFLLSVVRAVQPKDELETLLAMQMGAVHAATMMMARRLNHVETLSASTLLAPSSPRRSPTRLSSNLGSRSETPSMPSSRRPT